ncbi:MAG: hypothetical protein K2P41_16995 [Lachnospiraceae bacterium]|nr:hypothetical protein [Lachnospiraceae bacterium]
MDTEREGAAIEMTQQEAAEKNTAENREDSIRREYGFAPDVKLKECRFCCVMIPKKAKVCPNCRMSLKRHWFRNLVAAVFAVAVIGGGGYYLSEHWGIMKDAVASVWRAQNGSAVPVMSVTTVDTAEMAANAAAVGPAEVTSLSEAELGQTVDLVQAAESTGNQTDHESKTANAVNTENTGNQTEALAGKAEQAAGTEGKEEPESSTDAESSVSTDRKTDAERMTETEDGADPESSLDAETANSRKSATDGGDGKSTEAAAGGAEDEKDAGTREDSEDRIESETRKDTENADRAEEQKDVEDKTDHSAEEETAAENEAVSSAAQKAEKKGAEADDEAYTNGTADSRSKENTAKKDGGLTEEESADTEKQETAVSAKDMDRQEQEYREECTTVSYKAMLRDTESCLDTALTMEVQVVCQVNGGLFDDNIYYLCKAEDGNNITRYYIVRDDREADDTLILEGDMLTVFGQLFGTCKIPADLIETRPVVPAVSMLYYDLTGE